MIYGDICALSPALRQRLYGQVRAALNPGGRFVFDVFTADQYSQRREEIKYERRLMDGFWAAGDYFGFLETFLYGELALALDRYLIVEPTRTREVFNWLQYFDADTITNELRAAGLVVEDVVDALTGAPWKPASRELAVIARHER